MNISRASLVVGYRQIRFSIVLGGREEVGVGGERERERERSGLCDDKNVSGRSFRCRNNVYSFVCLFIRLFVRLFVCFGTL